MKIAVIDNYDSFTYNLVHCFKQLGVDVDVMKNDRFEPESLDAYAKIVLSPGPGIPEEAGRLLDAVRHCAGRIPLLGVCLGHQAIGEMFGAKLTNLDHVFHGVASAVDVVTDDYLFSGMPRTIEVGRYHSWVIDRDSLPDVLEAVALSSEGQIMAVRRKTYDVRGVQFHPESVLTPLGTTILSNWLSH